MTLRKFVYGACILAGGLAVGAAVVPAEAHPYDGDVVCQVARVAWKDGGELQIDCGGNFYYGFASHASCHTVGLEVRKSWFSLAQSALLSGKNLYIEFDYCAGRTARYVRLGD